MRTIGEKTTPFIPENPISKTILSMLNDEESADVVFEVENEKVETSIFRKSAKTMTSFHAHRTPKHSTKELSLCITWCCCTMCMGGRLLMKIWRKMQRKSLMLQTSMGL